MNVFIRQLTGIRLVAAVWVLLYHSQGPLDAIGVLGIPVLPDFIRVGRLGVDLFFALWFYLGAHLFKFTWRTAQSEQVHEVFVATARTHLSRPCGHAFDSGLCCYCSINRYR